MATLYSVHIEFHTFANSVSHIYLVFFGTSTSPSSFGTLNDAEHRIVRSHILRIRFQAHFEFYDEMKIAFFSSIEC